MADGYARALPVPKGSFFLFGVRGVGKSTWARTNLPVNGYLDILDDTLLTTRLRAFEGRLRVRERRHPKLYWTDTGLVRAVKKQVGPVAIEERGPLLEGWVLSLLRAYGEVGRLFDEISYWASANVEVDFLLERGGEHLALEVKSSPRIGSAHLAGLRAVADLRSVKRRILVYPGRLARRTEDGIEIWPLATLVERLEAGTLWR